MADEQKKHDAGVAQAKAEQEAAAAGGKRDEIRPGGRFLTADGRLVDANGNPLDEKKDKAP